MIDQGTGMLSKNMAASMAEQMLLCSRLLAHARCYIGLLILGAHLVAQIGCVAADTRNELMSAMEKAIADGDAVGMQVLIGEGDKILFSESRGLREPGGTQAVDDDTMFCIGSCSKPLASIAILKLAEDGRLSLIQPIDRWLPKFEGGRLIGGALARRAPTLTELLCHRAGIYSQKERITRHQASLLYEYDHTLTEAVTEMAKERYIAEPGQRFAYSGAGYCIAGRVAEVATGQSFDQILQRNVCEPLKMKRTTYFPNNIDANIAIGAIETNGRLLPNERSPHRADPHKMQLIGGSIYSTATDLAKFARMVGGEMPTGKGRLVTNRMWQEMLRSRGEGSNYGLGWTVSRKQSKPLAVFHSGSLASSRANLRVDLKSKRFLVILYSVVNRPGQGKSGLMAEVNAAANALFVGEPDRN